jgi:DNA-binding XRE family transcriptional regulator
MDATNKGVSLTTNMLGNELIKYRALHSTTYEAIAKEMELSQQTIFDIRNFSVKKPDYVTAIRIISLTGMSNKNRDLILKTDYPFMYEHNKKMMDANPSNDIDKPYLYRVMDSIISYASFESADCCGISRQRIIKIWGSHSENIIDDMLDKKILTEDNGILRTNTDKHHRITDRAITKKKHKYALDMIDTEKNDKFSDWLSTATEGISKGDFKRLRAKAIKYHLDFIEELKACKKGDNPVFFNIALGKFTNNFHEDEQGI